MQREKETKGLLLEITKNYPNITVITKEKNTNVLIDGKIALRIYYRTSGKREVRIDAPLNSWQHTMGKELEQKGIAYQKPTAKPYATRGYYEFYVNPENEREAYIALLKLEDEIKTNAEPGRAKATPDDSFFPEEIRDAKDCYEGAVTQVTVNRYERSAEAREQCIKRYGAVCLACGFDFEEYYGECGKGFIHVHHIKLINEIGKEYRVDYKRDLITVCPNCHAMLHRGMTLEEIRAIALKKAKY